MSDVRLRSGLAALALIGAAIAAYLTYTHYADESVFCISGGSGCETVQSSRYAETAGVPVALLGLAAYGALFATACASGRSAAAVGAVVALTGVVFSAWLLIAQVALIDAICHWCVANDIVITAVAAVAIVRLRSFA